MLSRVLPQTSGRARSGQWLLLLLGGLAVFLLSHFATVETRNGDFTHTLLVSQAILEQGTVRLDAYKDRVDYARDLDYNYRVEKVNGHYYYRFPMGPSVLLLPVAWLANLWGYDMAVHDQEYELIKLLASISSAIIFMLVYKLCTYYLPPLPSLVISAVSVLGSAIISTLGTALWNMHFALLFVLLVLLLLVRLDTGRAKTVHPFLLGLLLFLAFWCRPTTAPLILLVLGYVWLRQRAEFLKLLFTTAGLLLVFVAWCWQTYGQPLPSYYMPGRLVATPDFWQAFYGNALSPARGLLIFSPFVVLVLGALAWFLPKRRDLFWLSLAWFVLHYISVSRKNEDWWGGHHYGSRLLVDALPALILITIFVWQEIAGRARPVTQTMLVGGYLALGLAGIWINTWQGLYNPSTYQWNKDPNIDRYPEYLFDWRYPQFLASEQSLQRRKVEHLEKRLNKYAIGETLRYDSSQALFWGWSEPDIGWRWTVAQPSQIVFRLGQGIVDPNGRYSLEILCGAAAPTEVEVRLNGVEIGRLSLAAFTGQMPPVQTLEVDGALLKDHDLNRLDFYRPGSTDVAFVSLKVAPSSPDKDKVYYYDGEFFESGFSEAEKGWRWTDGRRASLLYPLAAVDPAAGYTLELTSGALGAQAVELVVNGTKIGQLAFEQPEPTTLRLPVAGRLLKAGHNRIDLLIPNAAVPPGDSRQLGLAFVSLKLYRAGE